MAFLFTKQITSHIFPICKKYFEKDSVNPKIVCIYCVISYNRNYLKFCNFENTKKRPREDAFVIKHINFDAIDFSFIEISILARKWKIKKRYQRCLASKIYYNSIMVFMFKSISHCIWMYLILLKKIQKSMQKLCNHTNDIAHENEMKLNVNIVNSNIKYFLNRLE